MINILNRGNDLEEFFWPIVYFVKQQILENHQFPFWNNLFFSGTPLLPDPQSPLFYPPNIIFLILPIDIAFLALFVIHAFIGAAGMFLLARTLGLKQIFCLFAAILYAATPKLFGYLEAGHVGLVTSFAWLPFIFLATVKLTKSPNIIWSIALALFFAAVFYTHILTLFVSAAASAIIVITFRIKNFSYLIISGVITFGLAAIALLPQLEWLPYTTRQLLTASREVFPQWNGTKELILSIFWPWNIAHNLDSEKWLPLGTLTIILGLVGFWHLTKKLKIIISAVIFVTLLFISTNLSPFYPVLLSQDWFVFLRVTTRVWFIPLIAGSLLAAYGLHTLAQKGVSKKLLAIAAILCFTEVFALSFLRLTKPAPQNTKFAPKEIYEHLKKDKEHFRVFCINRCISQKEAALNNLELIEGYNTLQQVNYYKHAWQLTGAYWNHYTLSIPPIGTYTFEKPQPDAVSLGEFNTKYVISPYELTDKNFVLQNKFGDYLVYKNSAVLPRAYFQKDNQKPGNEAPIKRFSPNHIQVDTSKHETQRLVLAEVWSPGWNAYLNGKEKVNVQERPNVLRMIDIKNETDFVDFKYEPRSFLVGRAITLLTLFILAAYSLTKWKKRKFSNRHL